MAHHVMVEYRKEIKAWPIIRCAVAEGYQRLYKFIQKCQSICMLLAKLPCHTRDK